MGMQKKSYKRPIRRNRPDNAVVTEYVANCNLATDQFLSAFLCYTWLGEDADVEDWEDLASPVVMLDVSAQKLATAEGLGSVLVQREATISFDTQFDLNDVPKITALAASCGLVARTVVRAEIQDRFTREPRAVAKIEMHFSYPWPAEPKNIVSDEDDDEDLT